LAATNSEATLIRPIGDPSAADLWRFREVWPVRWTGSFYNWLQSAIVRAAA